jgi:hypothetical protein
LKPSYRFLGDSTTAAFVGAALYMIYLWDSSILVAVLHPTAADGKKMEFAERYESNLKLLRGNVP